MVKQFYLRLLHTWSLAVEENFTFIFFLKLIYLRKELNKFSSQ